MFWLRVIATAVGICAFATTPIAAQQPSPSPAAAEKGDRVVCKSELRTGTRFKTRICKPWSEWEAMREQHKRDGKELADRPLINPDQCQRGGC